MHYFCILHRIKKLNVDETGLDETKVDETAVDKIAVDEPGPHRKYSLVDGVAVWVKCR